MRDQQEIQRAHDILEALVLGDVPNVMTEEEAPLVLVMLDTLCWVLGHDANDAFARNLRQIEADIEALGFRLHREVN
jgi:hypothetical protein